MNASVTGSTNFMPTNGQLFGFGFGQRKVELSPIELMSTDSINFHNTQKISNYVLI